MRSGMSSRGQLARPCGCSSMRTTCGSERSAVHSPAHGKALPWSPAWADGRLLPQLVRVELLAQGTVDWPQLDVPLRVNPAQAGLSRMGMRGGSIR